MPSLCVKSRAGQYLAISIAADALFSESRLRKRLELQGECHAFAD